MDDKNQIEIFISYSTQDELFIKFVNSFLFKSLFKNYPAKNIRFTAREGCDLEIFQEILEIIEDFTSTKLFICYISENYLNSEFCMLEMGAALYRKKTDKDFNILCILDDISNDNKSILLKMINTRIHSKLHIIKASELINPFTKLFNFKINKKEIKKDLWVFKKNNDLKNYSYLKTQNNKFFQYIASYISRTSSEKIPITLFCNRDDYERWALNTLKEKKHSIVWTIYKSPLLLEDAFENHDLLTEYDKRFQNCEAAKKKRLIIF